VALAALTGCGRGANGSTPAAHDDGSSVAVCGFDVFGRGVCGSEAAGHNASTTVWGIVSEDQADKWLTVPTASFPVDDLKLLWKGY